MYCIDHSIERKAEFLITFSSLIHLLKSLQVNFKK